MLFGAVALTGILAGVGMQTITGPVTTITRVTQKNITDTHLLTNAAIVIANATSADFDSDGTIEPAEYMESGTGDCTISLTGGGCFPTTLGVTRTDPWGTMYGYCVWDHGSTIDGRNDAGAGSTLERLQGSNTTIETKPVIAIISAGADKTFQTSCAAYDGAGSEGVVKVGGSDDFIYSQTYAEASSAGGGLWSLKPADATTATIGKDLEIGTGVNQVSVDSSTGIGSFIGVTTNTLSAKDGNTVDISGGLIPDAKSNFTTCVGTEEGALRINDDTSGDPVLEVCDGAGTWNPIGSVTPAGNAGEIQFNDGAGGLGADSGLFWDNANKRLGVGVGNPQYPLDVNGYARATTFTTVGTLISNSRVDASYFRGTNSFEWADVSVQDLIKFKTASTERMRITSTGNVGIGTTSPGYPLSVNRANAGTVASFSSTGGAGVSWYSAANYLQETFSGNALIVSAAGKTLGFGSNASEAMRIDTAGNVGIGTTSPSETLDVSGTAIISKNVANQTVALLKLQNNENSASPGAALEFQAINANITAQLALTYNSGYGQFGLYSRYGSEPMLPRYLVSSVNLPGIHRWYGNSSDELMRLEPTGDVGIGITSPSSKLEVNGAIKLGSQTGCAGAGGNNGTIRYNSIATELELCVSGTWKSASYIANLDDIGDVNAPAPAGDEVLTYDSVNNEWKPKALGAISGNGDNLGNHTATANVRLNGNWLSNDGGSEGVYVDADGDVGIGTSVTNVGKLTVEGATGGYFRSGSSNQSIIVRPDNAQHSYISISTSNGLRDAGIGFSNTAGSSNWRMGLGSDSNFKIEPGNIGSGNMGGSTFTITSTGNVGVGITSPAAPLHVHKGAVDAPAGGIVFSRYWASDANTRSSAIFHYYNSTSGAADALAFSVSQGSNPYDASHIKMLIDRVGNVGIGDISPDAKLDVAGTIRAVELCDENGANCSDLSVAAAGKFMDGDDSNDAVYTTGDVGVGTTAPTHKLEVAGSSKFDELKIGPSYFSKSFSIGNFAANSTYTLGQLNTRQNFTDHFKVTVNGYWGVKEFEYYGYSNGFRRIVRSREYQPGKLANLDVAVEVAAVGSVIKIQLKNNALSAINYVTNIFVESFVQTPSADSDWTDLASGSAITETVIASSNVEFIDRNGNIGIGTEVPGAELDVAGDIHTEQICDENGANCKDISAGWAAGAATPAGTTGQVQFNNGGSMGADTDLHWDNANKHLGIGTSTPDHELEVEGDTRVAGQFAVNSIPGSGVQALVVPSGNNHALTAYSGSNTYTGNLLEARYNGTATGFNLLKIATDNGVTPVLVAKPSGNVGIGTASPSYRLHVSGNPGETYAKIGYYWVFASDKLSSVGAMKLAVPAAESIHFQQSGLDRLFIQANTGNVGIGTAAPGQELEVNGDILLGAAAPVLYLGNDSDQYISGNAASNYLTVSTANAERLRISSTGNIGIGTTGPTAKLHVSSGNAAADAVLRIEVPASATADPILDFLASGVQGFRIGIDTSDSGKLKFDTGNGALGGSTKMTITTSGNVGIGDTNPGAKLDVAGAINAEQICDETGANCKDISTGWSGGLTADSLDFTDFIDAMTLDASTDIASTGTNELSITNTGTGDSFIVNDEAADTSPFVVDAAGNVGIGTATPTVALQILGTSAGSELLPLRISNDDSTAGTAVGIDFRAVNNSGSTTGKIVNERNAAADYAMRFYNFGGSGLFEAMTIDKVGNVGVGTSSPSAKAHIVGPSAAPTALAEFDTASTAQFQNDGTNKNSLYIAENGNNVALQATDGLTNSVLARSILLNPYGGNVGIGTAMPATLLDVTGSFKVSSGGRVGINTNPASNGSSFTSNANYFGFNAGRFYQSASSATSSVVYIKGGATPATGGHLLEWANSSATPLGVIDAAGNLGIGTISPGVPLDIRSEFGGGVSDGQIRVIDTTALAANNGGSIALGHVYMTNGSLKVDGAVIKAKKENATSSDQSTALTFSTSGTNSTAERVRIDSSGNVGIGTTAPGTKLDVSGNAHVGELISQLDPSLSVGRNTSIGGILSNYAVATFGYQNDVVGIGYSQTDDVGYIIANTVGSATRPLSLNWDHGTVVIGAKAPEASAELDITSTSKGFLPPRMTTVQVGAIASPADGLIVYDATADELKLRANGAWISLADAASVSGGVTADSLDFADFKDAMTLDASTDIAATGTNELSITNTGTGDSFVVNDQAADTSPFVVDAAGNVGIGTSSPAHKLDVVGPFSGGSFRVASTSSTGGRGFLAGHVVDAYGSFVGGDTAYYNSGFWRSKSTEGSAIRFENGRIKFLADNGLTIDASYTPSTRMTISASGNVGIGTTSPGGTVDVAGEIRITGNDSFAANVAQIYKDANNGLVISGSDGAVNEFILVDSSGTTILKRPSGTNDLSIQGNVGIGPIAPVAKLEIDQGTTAHTAVAILRENSNTAITTGQPQLEIINDNATAGNYANIYFSDAVEGPASAIIGAKINDHTNNYGDLQFWTRDSSGAGVRMHIDQAGNVGIGTTNPTGKFQVETAGVSSTDGMRIRNKTDGHYLSFRPSMSAGANNGIVQAGDTGIIYTNGSIDTGAFVIAPWATTTSGLRMDSSGNVGIGDTTPDAKLDVAGNIYAEQICDETGANCKDISTGWSGGAGGGGSGKFVDGTNPNDAVYTLGNVGIGTTSPGYNFDVKGAAGATATIRVLGDSASSTAADLQLTSGGTGPSNIWFGDAAANGSSSKGRLYYAHSADAMIAYTNGAERLRISNTGNVGIGTTNPTAKLEIGGTAGLDGIKFPDGTTQTTAALSAADMSTISVTAIDGGVGSGTNYSSYVACPSGKTLVLKSMIACTASNGLAYQYCWCEQSGNSLRAALLTYSSSVNLNYKTSCEALCIP